jgi:hypothetical protein
VKVDAAGIEKSGKLKFQAENLEIDSGKVDELAAAILERIRE